MAPDSIAARRRILVVDDEPHIGRIIRFKLEQGPYDVILAHDGAAALAILRETEPIDLVLLDIMLPSIGGIELLAQIRRMPHRKDTPVIMLTAKGNETDREQAQALGAFDFIVKPFSPKRLLARITEIFNA
jgi:DNA-binding response OmpR family regulator